MPVHHRPRRAQRQPRVSRADAAIAVLGLIAAAGSSVAAYRVVGPYGDGPINVGLYRTQDPETGQQFVYREVPSSDGTVLRYLFDDGTRKLMQIQAVHTVDGKVEAVGVRMGNGGITRIDAAGQSVEPAGKGGLVKVGFSLRGNGVIDAWEFRDAAGQLAKIEVSRRQDGRVDRWEYYKNDQLERVDLDENRDGRVDHWLTYEAGILVKEAWDRDFDGNPDPGR